MHRFFSIAAVGALLIASAPAAAEDPCEELAGSGGRGHCAVRENRSDRAIGACDGFDGIERGLCERRTKENARMRGIILEPVRRAVGRKTHEACSEFERGSDALRDCLKSERMKILETHPRAMKQIRRVLLGREITDQTRSGGRVRRFVRDSSAGAKGALQACKKKGTQKEILDCIKGVRDRLREETGANP